ncbi:hypothetical protein HGI30_01820 [Paenibacillus albicereus]|uniref:Uncharacterized protein n=1 Tax=Paenibacillus albicereus TaxID=2726185 RepID=A0A6H2GST0_9BACL|nr:DUF6376 family protein [Paenibacillus albicereus]QJC50452.1 hypothetical protein HGI30_01820 [Paenibacillus albicereus]
MTHNHRLRLPARAVSFGRRRLLALLLAPALLAGCSLPGSVDEAIGGVNDSLTYVNEATTYINEASQFSNQLPDLAQQALTDPDALATLESELTAMKSDIAAFNGLTAPEFASAVDAKLEQANGVLNGQIDSLLQTVNSGQLTAQAIEQSQIGQTLTQITEILDQVKQLGG